MLSGHANMLVIRQPQRIHREIEVLLSRLRNEVSRTVVGQAPNELMTLTYPINLGEDFLSQLIKAAATCQPGNQNVQLQLPKIAEQKGDGGEPVAEQVGRAIIDLVEPDSWKKNGGQGDLRSISGAIIVRQTPEVHALIQKALITISRPGGYLVPATAVSPLSPTY